MEKSAPRSQIYELSDILDKSGITYHMNSH